MRQEHSRRRNLGRFLGPKSRVALFRGRKFLVRESVRQTRWSEIPSLRTHPLSAQPHAAHGHSDDSRLLWWEMRTVCHPSIPPKPSCSHTRNSGSGDNAAPGFPPRIPQVTQQRISLFSAEFYSFDHESFSVFRAEPAHGPLNRLQTGRSSACTRASVVTGT